MFLASTDPTQPRSAALTQKGFRRDIQGIRGFALVLVLACHARLSFAEGGFAGLDVFFVLSGFLITGLLLAELERTGTLSLLAFYGRRARRLSPLAITVLAVTAAISASTAAAGAMSDRRGSSASLRRRAATKAGAIRCGARPTGRAGPRSPTCWPSTPPFRAAVPRRRSAPPLRLPLRPERRLATTALGRKLRRFSPLAHVRRIRAPLLLEYGRYDRLVPLAQGEALAAAHPLARLIEIRGVQDRVDGRHPAGSVDWVHGWLSPRVARGATVRERRWLANHRATRR